MTSTRTPPKGPDWRNDWKAFGVLATSAAQRKALWQRESEGGIYTTIQCHYCSMPLLKRGFEAEHQVPLHLIDRQNYPICLAMWSIDQLVATCRDCHKEKTARETKERAKADRISKKLRGETKPKAKISKRGFPILTPELKAKIKENQKAFREQIKERLRRG